MNQWHLPEDPAAPVAFVDQKGQTRIGKRLFVPCEAGYVSTKWVLMEGTTVFETTLAPQMKSPTWTMDELALPFSAEMPEERLQQILKRTDHVKGRAWLYKKSDDSVWLAPDDGRVCEYIATEEDGYLIAHAPKDLRDLVAEVYRLRKELAVEREACDEWAKVVCINVSHPALVRCVDEVRAYRLADAHDARRAQAKEQDK